MPVAKKKRGATAVRDTKPGLQLPTYPRLHLIAMITVGLAVALVLALSPDSNEAAIQAPRVSSIENLAPEPEPEPEPVVVAAPLPRPEMLWESIEVKPGDNLSLIFNRAGYTDRDVYEVVSTSAEGRALAKIFPGQSIDFQADEQGRLAAVRHVRSRLESVTYKRAGDGFNSRVILREPEVRETWVTGTITSSLYMAGQEAGLSQALIMELANIFGGVIDFVLDPRKGDTIDLIYEELYLDGEKLRDGDIVAANFTNQGETFSAFRYKDSAGDYGYYNEEGVSMRKAFLMAPVDFTRISSNFNMRRLHPIYKTTRPHRGTDYAAPTGTPVFAAGDGRVIEAGYTRANGNYLFIQHGEAYVTRYLHLHKRHVKRGQRVAQSQVIGTVGSTGAATGPHLHYEFLMHGVHRNPRTIHKKLPKAKSLPETELALFRQAINTPAMQLAALRSDNQLALNQPSLNSPKAP